MFFRTFTLFSTVDNHEKMYYYVQIYFIFICHICHLSRTLLYISNLGVTDAVTDAVTDSE